MTLIVLDAGHGGKDSGAANGKLYEKFITLQLASRCRMNLESMFECEVQMTRGNDISVSLEERTDFSNEIKADFFYSFHVNASRDKSDPGDGFESYIYNKLTSKSKTAQMQSVIHGYIVNEVMKKYGIRDRGRKKANLHVCRETVCPAVLGEYLFIDNPKEAARLQDFGFLNELSFATAHGIGMALNLKRKKEQDPKPKDPPKKPGGGLYVVQAGAFRNEDNAKRRLMALRNAGFKDSFIKREE